MIQQEMREEKEMMLEVFTKSVKTKRKAILTNNKEPPAFSNN